MEDGNNRLAELTRDILGAKGLHEIMTQLLASLPEERKLALAEELLRGSINDYSTKELYVRTLTSLIGAELKKGAQDRIIELVRQGMANVEEKLVKELTTEVEKCVREKVREAFGTGRSRY